MLQLCSNVSQNMKGTGLYFGVKMAFKTCSEEYGGDKVSQSIQGRLISRNINIDGHRTSLRLEADAWSALDEMCGREQLTIHELCSVIEHRRIGPSRTAAVRAFVLTYFREATTDVGHVRAGHGQLKYEFGAMLHRSSTSRQKNAEL